MLPGSPCTIPCPFWQHSQAPSPRSLPAPCRAQWGLTGTPAKGWGGINGLSASLTCHLWSRPPQAFSGFYYTLHFLNLTEGQPLSLVNASIREICNSTWKQVRLCIVQPQGSSTAHPLLWAAVESWEEHKHLCSWREMGGQPANPLGSPCSLSFCPQLH